ncbi:DUF6114 domain-containing protein [Microbispora sp. NBC_01389]|uniref:DUF6114 domain-containing protein n=1 Tax=Microbispora sp. NBC_01389 TaxID=2903584 RepID=UPI003253FA8F
MNGSWRRSRPFWGGLLVLLAGLELLSIPFATKALPLVIRSGTVGATYLIALVLVILGLMIWLQPGQRAFLGVVAMLVSIASFVYANLGGFLVGMLLGLVGGALAVAWAPEETAPRASGTPAEPSGAAAPPAEPAVAAAPPAPGGGEITFTTRRVVGRDEHLRPSGGQDGPPGRYEGSGGPGAGSRALAIAMLPVLLVTGTGVPQDDPGASAQHGTISRAVSHAVPDAVSTLLPGAVPSAVSGVVPDVVPTIVPTDLPGALGSANPLAPLTGGRSRSPSASPSPGMDDQEGQAPPAGPAGGQVRVAVESAAVRAPSLTMTGMKFTGVVEMPTATGMVKMLRFTMRKAVLERPQQTIGSTTLVGSTFTFEGNVVICTTKMTGKLLGVPQRFTAEHPNILVRALTLVPSLNVPLTMTDVVSEQPYVTADSLRADDLHLVAGA